MKPLLLVCLISVISLSRGAAELVTFRFAGTVFGGGSETVFRVGGRYALTVTIDTATVGTPFSVDPQFGMVGAYYTNAIASVGFDYGSGAYVAEAEGHGDVEILNDDRGLYDQFVIHDRRDEWRFPAVDTYPYTGFGLWLVDRSHRVFETTELPRDLNLRSFGGPQASFDEREANMNWGSDWESRYIVMTIDEVVTLRRMPYILAHDVVDSELRLTIELAGAAQNTLVERALVLGPKVSWELVATLGAGTGTTNWNALLSRDVPAAFYRVRTP
jgi:hypothetical protein